MADMRDRSAGERVWTAVVLALLWLAAMDYRADFLGPSPYPPNDGALFVVFAEAVRAAGFALPVAVEFNGARLPFAYPPLSFYLVAAVAEAGVPLLAVAKWYPIVVAGAAAAAGLLLLRRLLPRSDALLAAAALFLFYHRSFEYLIMGGGISRATGALFAALALLAAERLAGGWGWGRAALAGFATGAAVLSHPEWGIAAPAGVVVLLACRAPALWPAALRVAAVGAIAALVVAPWAATVLAEHGPAPFAHASSTSAWNPSELALRLLSLQILPAGFALFAGLGIVVALRRGEPLWPLLLLAAAVLTPRSALTVAALPAAALAGLGVATLLDAAADALRGRVPPGLAALAPRLRPLGLPLLALALAGSQLVANAALSDLSRTLIQLDAPSRAALRWVASETPEGTRVAVLSGAPWFVDRLGEWFPLLTGREAVTTAQGREWLPGESFRRRAELSLSLARARGCAALHAALARAEPHEAVLDATDSGCFDGRRGYEEIHRAGPVRIFRRAGAPSEGGPAER